MAQPKNTQSAKSRNRTLKCENCGYRISAARGVLILAVPACPLCTEYNDANIVYLKELPNE